MSEWISVDTLLPDLDMCGCSGAVYVCRKDGFIDGVRLAYWNNGRWTFYGGQTGFEPTHWRSGGSAFDPDPPVASSLPSCASSSERLSKTIYDLVDYFKPARSESDEVRLKSVANRLADQLIGALDTLRAGR